MFPADYAYNADKIEIICKNLLAGRQVCAISGKLEHFKTDCFLPASNPYTLCLSAIELFRPNSFNYVKYLFFCWRSVNWSTFAKYFKNSK
jgi:hypothetical protein